MNVNEDIVINFGNGETGLGPDHTHRHSQFPLYGTRVNHIWVHNWINAYDRDIAWFSQSVLCRLAPGGQIHFVGWDGSIVNC